MIDLTNITILPSGKHRVRLEYRGEVLGGTFASAEEAVEVRDALKRKIVDGDLVPTKGSSTIDLGPTFLHSRAGNRSIDDDEGRWDLHIKRASWARLRPEDVTRKHGSTWLDELKKKRTAYDPKQHGKRASKFLSWGQRRHCLNLARRFFAWAIEEEIIGSNPFVGLVVEREDGDEDEGYQEDWYLDVAEQRRIFDLWLTHPDLDARDRLERFMYGVALWTGLRISELWCLHLTDLHVDGDAPHIFVRYGSWDPIKERYRSPKGKKGTKKTRPVPLWGFGLECARAWLEVRAEYLRMNPRTERERKRDGYIESPLVFPTERGRRRDNKPPRSWKTVANAFGMVPRIGEKPWWHLLRHSCASSLISCAWQGGEELARAEIVQQVLGHADIRTTMMYAHVAPKLLHETAARAEAAFQLAKVIPIGRHAAVTASGPSAREAGNSGHAREDSNLRPTAPEGVGTPRNADEVARRDGVVTAIRHVLTLIADEELVVPEKHVRGLEIALDEALAAYQVAVVDASGGHR